MIGFIKGKVVDKWDEGVVLEVQGLGYEVHMPGSMAAMLSTSQEAMLHTHLVWREDTVTLYGFDSKETRDMFRLLLEVSGVGPRVALNILSMLSADELIEILAQGESRRLQAVHGVGKKTAARLCVDLKERAKNILKKDVFKAILQEEKQAEGKVSTPIDDALSALLNLGYREKEAGKALLEVRRELGPGAGVEELVKSALKILSKGAGR